MKWCAPVTMALLAIVLWVMPAMAQFQIATPTAMPPADAQGRELALIRWNTVRDSLRDLYDVAEREHKRAPATHAQPSDWRATADALTGAKPVMSDRVVRWGLWHKDASGALRLYARNNGIAVLGGFGASLSSDEAYVQSELLSGLAGYWDARLTLATALSATTAASSGAGAQDDLRRIRTTLLEIVNNGGEATLRLSMPIYADRGTSRHLALGYYASIGGEDIGGEHSQGVVSGVLEFVDLVTLRNPDDYSSNGELFFGLRGGAAWAPADFGSPAKGLVSGLDRQSMAYVQVALGAVAPSRTRFSVLGTIVPKVFRDYVASLALTLDLAPKQ